MSGLGPELSAWLRQRIAERLYLARHAIELGSAAEWVEQSSGVLRTIAADASQDRWDGVHALGDSSLTRLMEANDPRDTIARCDAELAILDLHDGDEDLRHGHWEGHGSREHWVRDEPDDCETCREPVPCRTLRLLASGYRHRVGWQEAWKP